MNTEGKINEVADGIRSVESILNYKQIGKWIFWGMFFSLFSLNVLNIEHVTLLCGNIVLLTGLKSLKNEDRYFRICYRAQWIFMGVYILPYIVDAFVKSKYTIKFGLCIGIAFVIIRVIVLIYFGKGIGALLVKNGVPGKENKLFGPALLYALINGVMYAVILAEGENISTLEIESLSLFIGMFAVTVWILVRLKKCCGDLALLREDIKPIKKGFMIKVTACLILVTIVAVVSTLYIQNIIEIDKGKEILTTDNAKAADIKSRMKEFGYNEVLLSGLEDEEVLKYETLKECKINSVQEDANVIIYIGIMEDDTTRVLTHFNEFRGFEDKSRNAAYVGIRRDYDMEISDLTGSFFAIDKNNKGRKYDFYTLELIEDTAPYLNRRNQEKDYFSNMFFGYGDNSRIDVDRMVIAEAYLSPIADHEHFGCYLAFTIDTSSGVFERSNRFDLEVNYLQYTDQLSYPRENLSNIIVGQAVPIPYDYKDIDGEIFPQDTYRFEAPMGNAYYQAEDEKGFYEEEEEPAVSAELIRKRNMFMESYSGYQLFALDQFNKIKKNDTEYYILDARESGDYGVWHAQGALPILEKNFSSGENINTMLENSFPDKKRIIIVYSTTAQRSYEICKFLAIAGYESVWDAETGEGLGGKD